MAAAPGGFGGAAHAQCPAAQSGREARGERRPPEGRGAHLRRDGGGKGQAVVFSHRKIWEVALPCLNYCSLKSNIHPYNYILISANLALFFFFFKSVNTSSFP